MTSKFIWIYTLSEPSETEKEVWIVRYVGYSRNIRRRYQDHLKDAKKRRSRKEKWMDTLDRQGIVPKMDIIDHALTVEEAWEKEIGYLLLYKKLSPKALVNGDSGGRGGKAPTDEVRKKIGDANRGKIRSAEWVEAKRDAMQGEKNPFFGHKHTEEFKEAISKQNKGQFSRPILQYSLEDGSFIREWQSTYDIASELGIDNSSITKACMGKRFEVGGFIWKYRDAFVDVPVLYEGYREHQGKNGGYIQQVLQKNMDGSVVKLWPSIKHAHEAGFHRVKVSMACNGKKPQYKGFLWSYPA